MTVNISEKDQQQGTGLHLTQCYSVSDVKFKAQVFYKGEKATTCCKFLQTFITFCPVLVVSLVIDIFNSKNATCKTGETGGPQDHYRSMY